MSAADQVERLEPDRAEIDRFVQYVHARAAHACRGVEAPGMIQVSTLDVSRGDKGEMAILGRYPIGDVERMARDAEAEAERGFNVYVEGRTVRSSLSLGKRGKAEDTVAVFALVVDNDAYAGKSAPCRGRPTVVESSPGSEHHWYPLDRALSQAEAAEIGKQMRGAGGDACTGNPTQPFRVAGTPNFPSVEKRRKYGRTQAPTRILTLSETVHAVDDLAALWPAAEAGQAGTTPGDDEDDFDRLLARCSPRLRANLANDDASDRSAHFYKTTGFLKREGFTLAQAFILWEGHPDGAAGKYEGRLMAELRRDWSKVKDEPRRAPSNDIVTEDNAASSFADRYGDVLRFDHDLGEWFEWDASHWRCAAPGLAFHWARTLARELAQNEDPRVRFIAGKASFAGSVEKFARNDVLFSVRSDVWDRDPFLLGTPSGTIDLRTGEIREPDPADGITKQTAVAPSKLASCTRWLAFLDETAGGDQGVIRLLQQWLGYCLTGATTEQALLFAYGPGKNGKSVFLNTVSRILADYAARAAMETFVASKFGSHPTELAMLRGARLVTASETEEGHAWAESRIKQMTGGDTITARFMRQDFFTFTPAFKLTIAGNHMPVLRNVDEAARRRFNIVPFTRQPQQVDRNLEDKLFAEAPAILQWMIDGCLDWQRNGLQRPAAVIEETSAYFDEQDVFSQWFADCCDSRDTMAFTPTRDLFGSWSEFARRSGEVIGTERTFAAQMARKGFAAFKGNKARGYRGVSLVVDEALL